MTNPATLPASAASRPSEPTAGHATLIRVFVDPAAGTHGGNPVPLVLDARGMTQAAMQDLAGRYGYEAAFVLPADDAARHRWRLRFFVPAHEMEMCGHATVGALWAMRQWGRWTEPETRVQTLSGSVDVFWDDAGGCAWISQPGVSVQSVPESHLAAIARVLRIDPAMPGLQAVNASTTRVKTLVRLPDVAMLDALAPDFGAMRELCAALDSTGLYPYVLNGDHACARQFPKESGYPEDAATGIAAAALWGYLHETDQIPAGPYTVRQGVAMGSPSAIKVRAREDAPGCWISGEVRWQP